MMRGDCHAVRHAPAHTMIMTRMRQVQGERHTQPAPRGGLCRRRGGSAPPDPAAQHTTAPHPRSGAAATPADPGVFAEQDHRRRRGTSRSVPTAQFIHSTHKSWALADATTHSPRPAITAASPPGLGFRCHDRLGGPIHECPGHLIWMTYSAPTGLNADPIRPIYLRQPRGTADH